MSQETSAWLNTMCLIGFTEKRGTAWHYRQSEQGVEPNHYPLAIPYEDVKRRLFSDRYLETPKVVVVDGKNIVVPGYKDIVRVDQRGEAFWLNTFTDGYKMHPYDEWLHRKVETILAANGSDLKVASAGLLRKGAVGWVTFEMEETAEVSGVQFRPFFTGATSLDGSLATTYNMGAQLPVCDNTLTGALSDKTWQSKTRHTVNSLTDEAVLKTQDALGLVVANTEAMMQEIYRSTNTPVSAKVWAAFLDSVTKPESKDPSKRQITNSETKRAQIEALWNSDPRVHPWQGTEYGVLTAMNTYYQHVQGVRGMHRAERNALRMVEGQFEKEDAETMATLRAVQARFGLAA